MINLVKDTYSCCGCAACMNACPRNAIEMSEDVYGFKFPHIDGSRCIECELCLKVCKFKNPKLVYPRAAYICQLPDKNVLSLSSSGGAFRALAEKIIEKGGVVFGCAYVEHGGKIVPSTIYVDNLNDLSKLSGSKYVQSEMGFAYKKVKILLEKGRIVLFSGTPCHISGLYGYLGKEYGNLYAVDLICHGVPNLKMFQAEISRIERKYKSAVKLFCFRDKKFFKWGIESYYYSFKLSDGTSYNGRASGLAYYDLFMRGEIIRDSCLKCPYACLERSSDITIGDAWGASAIYGNLNVLAGGSFDFNEGLSLVAVNTIKGWRLFSELSTLILKRIDYGEIAKFNPQLRSPFRGSRNRDRYMSAFESHGITGLYFMRFISQWPSMLKSSILRILPIGLNKSIKRFFKKR